MKRFFLALFWALTFTNINACDVCGAAVSVPGSDALPGIYSNFVGLHTAFTSFETSHIPLFNEAPWKSRELFSNQELHGRYSPTRRIQFIGSLPLHQINKKEMGISETVSGIGDFSLRTNYILVDKVNKVENKVFNVFLGGTAKLPTGRNDLGQTQLYYPENIRPGTGTFDFSLHLDFILRNNKWGAILSNAYTFRGSQGEFYQFGDLIQQTVTGFYFHELEKHQIMLEGGFQTLWMDSDYDRIAGMNNPYSGGVSLSPMLRASLFRSNWIMNLSLTTPLHQNLADNQVRQFFALRAGVIYQFLKDK